MIDISPLNRAIESLDKAIQRSKASPFDDLIRDGVIQRFEYTYELSIKMLKRVLEQMSASPSEVDGFSFNHILREAAEKGLINDVNQWITYRHQRNLTSHTYNQEKAEQVYEHTLLFVNDAKALFTKLKERIDEKS